MDLSNDLYDYTMINPQKFPDLQMTISWYVFDNNSIGQYAIN